MEKCSNCGKEYWTIECLNCKNKEKKEPLSERDKLYKIIRYAIIFFISIFIIGAIAEIYVISKVVDTTTPMMNDLNKMTNTMNKATEKMIKDMEKTNEQFNKK